MNKIFHITIIFFVIIISALTLNVTILQTASYATTVGIIDTVFDLDNPLLAKSLDQSSLTSISIKETSLKEYNRQKFTQTQKEFTTHPCYQKANELLLTKAQLGLKDALKNHSKLTQELEMAVALGSNYYHGTHVAGIILNSNSSNKQFKHKIVPFPFISSSKINIRKNKKLTKKMISSLILQLKNALELFELNPESISPIEEINQLISTSKPKVVNLSIGFNVEKIVKFYRKISAPDITTKMLYELVQLSTAFGRKKFDFIVKNNPHVLFVSSAGNNSENLDKIKYPQTLTSAPNLIIVGSSSYQDKQKLSKISNYGKKTVDLIAPGEKITSLLAKGDKSNNVVTFSGTSMSAPLVTRIIADIFQEYEDQEKKLSVEEVKKIFFSKYTNKCKNLSNKVKDGCYLDL
ncbi:MAG: S8 family serine peptidase [Oligoflexia bacterium]|nr:S8 family serine peptidase [Oligoflexia bacterium]